MAGAGDRPFAFELLEGCLGRLLLQALGVAMALGGAGAGTAFVRLALPRGMRTDSASALGTVGGAFAGLAAFLVVLVWLRARRLARADEAFAPLGFAGRAYFANGRVYQGTYAGRPASARYARGPSLELTVGSTVATRAAVVPRTARGEALAPLFGMSWAALADPAFEGLRARAADEAWLGVLLSHPQAKALVLRLCSTDGALRMLKIGPGAVQLVVAPALAASLSPEAASAMLADLASLASLAEGVPRATPRLAPGRLDPALAAGSVGSPAFVAAIAGATVAVVLLLAGIAAAAVFAR